MMGPYLDVDRDPAVWRTLHERLPVGLGVMHTHTKHQLLLAETGMLVLETASDRAFVTPGVCAWIPARRMHAAHARTGTTLLSVYTTAPLPLSPAPPLAAPAASTRTRARAGPVASDDRVRLFRVPPWFAGMLTALSPAPPAIQAARGLPWLPQVAAWAAAPWPAQHALPTSAALRTACLHALAHLADITVPDAARAAGMAQRTLARRFRAEMGMPFVRWLARVRVHEAAARLCSTQAALVDIALDVGFQSQSAFSAAFRAELGLSPGRYRRTHGAPG